MEACGILIDLSEPIENSPLKPAHSKSPPLCEESRKSPDATDSQRKSEDSQDSLADSIEIERSCDRRGSYTIDRSQLLQDLSEITAESDSDQTRHIPPAGGIQLLEDEEFDFDLPLSPAVRVLSSPTAVDEDDEEVFIGPIGFTEKCVATVVSEIAPLQEPLKPLSPLKPHQIAEIFKEAQLVVYRINNEEKDEEGKGPKRESLGRRGRAQTPVKHQRKGTFTESPDAFIRLPESVVKAMPVIDIEINDPFETKVEENKENSHTAVTSRLAAPKSRTLPGTTQSGKGQSRSGHCMNDAAASDTDDCCSVTSDTSESSLSRLPVNRPGVAKSKVLTGKTGLKRPSMLKPPGANKSNENLSTSINSASKTTSSTSVSTKIVPPAKSRRSLNTSSRKSIGLNTSGIPNSCKPAGNITSKETEGLNRKGPTTRLSLVKPGTIQKPVIKAQQQTTESKGRTGPLKALPITSNIPEKAGTVKPALTKQMLLNPEVCTPVKADKKVQPKLLSTNFTTPVRSNSVSSCTPASARRKSCLPTPQKTRCGSTSSIPQPSPVVRPSGNSTHRPSSSSTHRHSVSESPFVNRSLRNTISTGKREIPKTRHSIAGKTSPIKSIPQKSVVRGIYQGRRSLAAYKTTAK
ncbi:G2 and S phase-expressed protein 1 isoform X1 [Magallana gigas]|uniref:G2 and S phase-expressed protein 1 isoform X1 n=1 Tax=Magallana gigas TaxID=29159 RepID=UPI00333F5A83